MTYNTIIEFPQQRSRGARLQRHIETIQQVAAQAPHPATESLLALLEQIKRTNAAISAYRAEIAVSGSN